MLERNWAAEVGAPAESSSVAFSLACAAFSCSCGRWAAGLLSMPTYALAISALVASCVANAAAVWSSTFRRTRGSLFAGKILLMLICIVNVNVFGHYLTVGLLTIAPRCSKRVAYTQDLRRWAEP